MRRVLSRRNFLAAVLLATFAAPALTLNRLSEAVSVRPDRSATKQCCLRFNGRNSSPEVRFSPSNVPAISSVEYCAFAADTAYFTKTTRSPERAALRSHLSRAPPQ